MSDSLEDILAEGYLGDLRAVDMAELRARRAACQEVETGLSYLRRLVQGRIDVVDAERSRRDEGGRIDDVEALIARLPAVLATSTRSPGPGRLPANLGTGVVDDALLAELDALVSDLPVVGADAVDDARLGVLREQLSDLEERVSAHRRELFGRIDAIEAELTRRYRTGEADVASLLDPEAS